MNRIIDFKNTGFQSITNIESVSMQDIGHDPRKNDPTRIQPGKNDPKKVDPTRIDPDTNDPRKVDPTRIPDNPKINEPPQIPVPSPNEPGKQAK
jgi:hypothetical protein